MANEGQARALNEREHNKFISFLRRNARNVIKNIAMAEVSFRTGCRVGSLALLELDDVLESDKTTLKEVIVLKRSIVKNEKTTRIFLTHPKARSALSDYISIRPNVKGVDTLFITQKGTAYTPHSLSAAFCALYKRAGMVGYSHHSNRRGFASSVMRQPRSNIVMLKTLLNHSNINTTALYVENDDETLASIVKNVGVR